MASTGPPRRRNQNVGLLTTATFRPATDWRTGDDRSRTGRQRPLGPASQAIGPRLTVTSTALSRVSRAAPAFLRYVAVLVQTPQRPLASRFVLRCCARDRLRYPGSSSLSMDASHAPAQFRLSSSLAHRIDLHGPRVHSNCGGLEIIIAEMASGLLTSGDRHNRQSSTSSRANRCTHETETDLVHPSFIHAKLPWSSPRKRPVSPRNHPIEIVLKIDKSEPSASSQFVPDVTEMTC